MRWSETDQDADASLKHEPQMNLMGRSSDRAIAPQRAMAKLFRNEASRRRGHLDGTPVAAGANTPPANVPQS
jgi:hypothetical protein